MRNISVTPGQSDKEFQIQYNSIFQEQFTWLKSTFAFFQRKCMVSEMFMLIMTCNEGLKIKNTEWLYDYKDLGLTEKITRKAMLRNIF